MWSKRVLRRTRAGVTSTLAIILMVAIIISLAGVLYVWLMGLGPGEDELSYVGADIESSHTADALGWSVEIVEVKGHSVRISNLAVVLSDRSGVPQERFEGFCQEGANASIETSAEFGYRYYTVEGDQGNVTIKDMDGDGKLERGDEIIMSEYPGEHSWQRSYTVRLLHKNEEIFSRSLPN